MKPQTTLTAMTLVEVLVALAVVAFVFSSLTKLAYDSLYHEKILELQDKMRNYAVEASQLIYDLKDKDWDTKNVTGIPYSFLDLLPGQNSQAYVVYPTSPTDTSGVTLQPFPTNCAYDPTALVFKGSDCVKTIPPETDKNAQIFARSIQRTDSFSVDQNQVSLQITVACVEGLCDPGKYPPFILTFDVFRTGGTQ